MRVSDLLHMVAAAAVVQCCCCYINMLLLCWRNHVISKLMLMLWCGVGDVAAVDYRGGSGSVAVG